MGQAKWLMRTYTPSDVGAQMEERDRLYGDADDDWLRVLVRGAFKTFTSEEIKSCVLTHIHYHQGTERQQHIFDTIVLCAVDMLTERLLKIEDIVNGNFVGGK
jgi:hypothetical protein